MTTVFEAAVTCAVCGREQRVQEMGSTSSFGPMDLDTRPPPVRRHSLWLWVHECEECGFVAPELRNSAPTDARHVASKAYRAELNHLERERLASRFVCRSLLDEAAGDMVSAGWRRVHAAWASDDAGHDVEACVQRFEAIGLFERARLAGARAMKSVAGGDEVLLADLSRRAGAFEQAYRYCQAGLTLPNLPPFMKRLLLFERRIAVECDTACHTVAEAQGEPDPGDEASAETLH